MSSSKPTNLIPRFVDKPATRYVGIGGTFTFDKTDGIGQLWVQTGPWLSSIPTPKFKEAFGVIFVPEPGTGDFGYMAAIEAYADLEIVPDLMVIDAPATRYAVFAHPGKLASLPDTFHAINTQWLPTSGQTPIDLTPGVISAMERYGPGFDPARGEGDIECWLPIKS